MSLNPIFPQFAAACRHFEAPQGFPRPFAALDWCPRCGQPDWAHQADAPERLRRLDALDSGDMADTLAYLAEYSPGALDVALAVIGPVDGRLESGAEDEPFCKACNASLGIFAADGPYYRHYRDTTDGDAQRYSAGHPTVIAWRKPAA